MVDGVYNDIFYKLSFTKLLEYAIKKASLISVYSAYKILRNDAILHLTIVHLLLTYWRGVSYWMDGLFWYKKWHVCNQKLGNIRL